MTEERLLSDRYASQGTWPEGDGAMVDRHTEERAELATLMLLGCFVAINGGAEPEEIQRLTSRAVDLIESWRA